MQRDEFNLWLRHHLSRFPGISRWLDRMPDTGDATTPTSMDVTNAWWQALGRLEQSECVEASNAMFRGEIEEPRSFDAHPRAIIRYVMHSRHELPTSQVERKPRYVDGVEMFDCPVCRDDGAVLCWSEKSMIAARDGKLGQPHTLYQQAVLCKCRAGKRRQNKRNPRPVYDEAVDLRVDEGLIPDALTDVEVQERLCEFVSGLATNETIARDAQNPPAGDDNVSRMF